MTTTANEHVSALELARRIRAGDDSSEAAVRRSLARIEALNPRLSAFVSVMEGRALAAARAMDARRSRGRLPPFHGVPIGIKDLHWVRGTFTRMGSRAFRWLYTPIDDATVKSVRRAGFVVLGKLSTSELALLPIVEPDIHPPTRNPWNPEHTAGGSSGGCAAAVASGMLPVAPGSDGGGSIRIPASFCGIVGHKPSRGLVHNPHSQVDPNGMTGIGPMARTVRDAAALLDVLTHRPMTSPDSFTAALDAAPGKLRVHLCVRPPFGETDPEVRDAVLGVADVLGQLGHEVVEVDPPDAELDEFLPIYSRLFADIPVISESRLQPMTRWFRAEGRRRTHRDAAEAHRRLGSKVDAWVGDADLVLTPTSTVPPPRVGEFAGLEPEVMWEAISPVGVFTAGFNVGGHPATSIPAGRTTSGLPIGAQLVGPRGQDARVLAVARQIERELGGM